jgi:AcrR family transcriptional regulator
MAKGNAALAAASGPGETSRPAKQGKRSLTKGAAKRQRILDTTASVIAQKGFANMTLQAVADEIGIYAASIYYYFPSRDDLVREVALTALDRFYDAIESGLETIPATGCPLERLKQAIRSMIHLYTSADDYFTAFDRISSQAPETVAAEIRERRLKVRTLLNDLVSAAQDSGDISQAIDTRLLRNIIVGATRWIIEWHDPEGRLSPEEIADTYVEAILYGAVPRA